MVNYLLLPALIAIGLLVTGRVNGQTFKVLHTFTSASGPNATNSDGANPTAGLVLAGNTLYGTAVYGGSSGWGTVFGVQTNVTGFAMRYDFSGGEDGANPYAELVMSGDTLYGTTRNGGSSDAGTVFAVNTDGTGFTVLHGFPATDANGKNSDGANPYAGLILSGNTLFGAANVGGTSGKGTLFAINANGSGFTTLHSFSGGSGGAYSSAGLILATNTLYGTDHDNLGRGTVFSVRTNGTGFTNYYAFTSGDLNGAGILTNSDGANPHARLLLSGSTLYGTAGFGGSSGQGAVFAISTDGSGFTNLHSFGAGAYDSFGRYTNIDGANPSAGLVLLSNTLYGTASRGGSAGNGTVFAINADGTGFTNLHSFTATPRYPQPQTNSDGANPVAGLILSGTTLYGTTANGGAAGNGTVFSLSLESLSVPGPQLRIIPLESTAILTWSANPGGFALQSAPNITGPFTNLPGATSPYTNLITDSQQFFRLKSN